MNNLQFLQHNKVRKLSQGHNRWPDIVLLADSIGEEFADVVVVTSKSYRRDRAIELAFEFGATIANVGNLADKLIHTISVEQFIEVFEENVLVVLDVPVIDDSAINTALMVLAEVPLFTVGQRMMLNESKIDD